MNYEDILGGMMGLGQRRYDMREIREVKTKDDAEKELTDMIHNLENGYCSYKTVTDLAEGGSYCTRICNAFDMGYIVKVGERVKLTGMGYVVYGPYCKRLQATVESAEAIKSIAFELQRHLRG